MQAIRKCSQHTKYAISAICIKPGCPSKRLICTMCMTKHQDHQQQHFKPIQQFFQHLQQDQFPKHSYQIQLIEMVKSIEMTLTKKITHMIQELQQHMLRANQLFKGLYEKCRLKKQSELLKQIKHMGYENVEQQKLEQLIGKQLNYGYFDKREIDYKMKWLEAKKSCVDQLKKNVDLPDIFKQLSVSIKEYINRQDEIHVLCQVDKREISVRANTNERVLDLKCKILKKQGFSTYFQTLMVYKGKILQNNHPLSYYNIDADSQLEIYNLLSSNLQ